MRVINCILCFHLKTLKYVSIHWNGKMAILEIIDQSKIQFGTVIRGGCTVVNSILIVVSANAFSERLQRQTFIMRFQEALSCRKEKLWYCNASDNGFLSCQKHIYFLMKFLRFFTCPQEAYVRINYTEALTQSLKIIKNVSFYNFASETSCVYILKLCHNLQY